MNDQYEEVSAVVEDSDIIVEEIYCDTIEQVKMLLAQYGIEPIFPWPQIKNQSETI